MTQKNRITLDDIADAVVHLREEGEKVTVRNVLAVTGGSSTTVLKYLAQFLDAEEQEEQFKVIGKDLLKALIKEIQVVTDKETKGLKKMITRARKLRNEAIDKLAKNEQQAATQKEKWGEKTAKLEDEIQAFQTALVRTESERDILRHDLEELKSESKDLRAQLTEQTAALAFLKGRNGYDDTVSTT